MTVTQTRQPAKLTPARHVRTILLELAFRLHATRPVRGPHRQPGRRNRAS